MSKTTRPIHFFSVMIIAAIAVIFAFLYLLERQATYENIKESREAFVQQEMAYYEQQSSGWSSVLTNLEESPVLQNYLSAVVRGRHVNRAKNALEKIFSTLVSNQYNGIEALRVIDKAGAVDLVATRGNILKQTSVADKAFFRQGMRTPIGEFSAAYFEVLAGNIYLHRSMPLSRKNKRLGLLSISINLTKSMGRYDYLMSMKVIDGLVFLNQQGRVLQSLGADEQTRAEAMLVYGTMKQGAAVDYESNVWSFVSNDAYGFTVLFLAKGERITHALNIEYGKLAIVIFISGFALFFFRLKPRQTLPLEEEVKKKEVIVEQRSHNFSSISDEIRQPMNTLLGSLVTLSETSMDALQKEYTATAKKSAECVLELANQIQDYGKISRGEFVLDKIEFDLRATLHDIAELMSAEAYEKGLEVSCLVGADVPKRVVGDATRLRQVMINLVGHAVRNTQSGEVSLSLSADGHQAALKYINIDISDTGNLIDQETILQQITLFSQLDFNDEATAGGKGLGLALSKHLIDLMEGEISSFENNVGGNTFRIRLPYPVVDLRKMPKTESSVAGKRILIVGEIENSQQVLSDVFAQWQMHGVAMEEFDRVTNVLREAYLSNNPFDICFIDISHSSSIEKAFELVDHIRQELSVAELAVVTLTTQGAQGDAKRARQKGIQAYLTKPLEVDTLRLTIHRVISAMSARHTELLTKHNLKEDSSR